MSGHSDLLGARFWAKVNKTASCWLWTAGIEGDGYAIYWHGGTSHRAHRFAYKALVGPIKRGLVLDHTCGVRHCVNPAHLEPVTNAENIRRGNTGKWQSSSDHARLRGGKAA